MEKSQEENCHWSTPSVKEIKKGWEVASEKPCSETSVRQNDPI